MKIIGYGKAVLLQFLLEFLPWGSDDTLGVMQGIILRMKEWRLGVLLLVALWLVGVGANTVLKVYPLADDYFQKVYMLTHQNKPYFLTVSCRQKDMLSISLTQKREFQEAPRFNIWGNADPRPPMGGDSYTLLKECKAEVRVNSSNMVEVRRLDGEPILSINNMTFSNLHNTFVIEDQSTKWGLGERFQEKFRVVDGKWTLWNRDKPWKIDRGQNGLSDQTYGFHPLYLARHTKTKLYHMLYFKNTFGILVEATKNGQQLLFHSVGGQMHFLVLVGQNDPEAVLESYHEYIGPSHLPPFWSMGYHQCRWGYESAAALEEMVKKFKEHDLPLDVFWSDLEYMDQKMIFTVNPRTHGGGKLNSIIKDYEVHFVPLLDAGVCLKDTKSIEMGREMQVFLRQPQGNNYYVGEVWPGQVHFVDFHHPNAFSFWKQQLQRLYQQVSFSGIWLDMNEPSNFRGNEPTTEPFKIQQNEGINQMTINVDIPHYTTSKEALLHREEHTYYGHMITVPTHEYLKEKGKRPFIISRSNSVGTGNFAGHWTGDNVASWEFLRSSINGNFLFQIYGMQMVGSDICGFNKDTTEELCSRWMQLGAFYPFSRNHNVDTGRSQEPYAFGDTLLETSRASLKTRYALLKQLYSFMTAKKGKGSFFRPIAFQFPGDEDAYQEEYLETEFLIDRGLLVTPIVYEGKQDREVYFPGKGQQWHSFKVDTKTGKPDLSESVNYQGGSKETIKNAFPSAAPTFLRGGYALLLNEPANRSAKLTNKFHLFAALKEGKASTKIMAINDYENDQHITACLTSGCFLEVTVSREGEVFSVSWSYNGKEEVRGSVHIQSIEVVDGSNKWSHEGSLALEGKGSKVVEMQSK